VTLDGSQSANGIPGVDDCEQELAFQWRQVSGPAASTIESPAAPVTAVRFSAPGSYVIELEVDDGAADDNLDTAEVEVTVMGIGGPGFRRGDADGSGIVDITDAIFVLSFLFLGGPTPDCLDAADADDSGTVDITAAIYSLTFLFLGGPAPPEPGPFDCGSDPTPDDLPECVYPGC
jgi:hypothetical protein